MIEEAKVVGVGEGGKWGKYIDVKKEEKRRPQEGKIKVEKVKMEKRQEE